jgi:hypothetical protein
MLGQPAVGRRKTHVDDRPTVMSTIELGAWNEFLVAMFNAWVSLVEILR